MNISQRQRMRDVHKRLLKASERREQESERREQESEHIVRDFEDLADTEDREPPSSMTPSTTGDERVRD